MIKEKTTFIFGAGLSRDYNFPTGKELRDKITDYITWSPDITNLPIHIRRLMHTQFNEESIISARESIREGNFDTIDEFMETRKEFRALAKALIACILMPCENKNISIHRDTTTCFYRFIFDKMMKDATLDNFTDNPVSFITFNYDRSFEYFIYRTLRRRFGLPEYHPKILKIMEKINILHVHGKLGKLAWDIGTGVYNEYNTKIDVIDFKHICEGIVSFVEVDKGYYEKAREEIKKATNLFFVGFGFHEINTKRLLDGIDLKNKNVMGTAFGKDDIDLKEIEKFTNGKLNSGNLIRGCNAVDFANKYLKGRI